MSDTAPPQTLKRPLMLFRAVRFGLVAMNGAGISVRFGIAAGQGGMHAPPARAACTGFCLSRAGACCGPHLKHWGAIAATGCAVTR